MQGDARENKINGFPPEKRSRLKKKHCLRHRTPLRGRANITIQTYGTEEVHIYYCESKLYIMRSRGVLGGLIGYPRAC